MKRKKIFFCHTGLASFVRTDIEILSAHYDLEIYHYKLSRSLLGKMWNILTSFFYSIYWVWRVDVVFVWFGGYHGFFPVLYAKLFGKRSIVVVGGYDASYVPSIGYGVFYQKGLLLWCVKRIYQWCTWICPVDESLVKSTNYYADPTGVGYKTGILNHMIIDEAKIKVIPTGYDVEKFKNLKVEHSFDIISVGYVSDDQNFVRKGFDLIFEIAKELSNLKIVIVGFANEYLDMLKLSTPSNITLINFVTQNDLVRLYSSSKIVLQLSMAEGLPNTLCEAMLCECIPIGSNVNGIPKAIGNTGLILNNLNINDLKSLLVSVLGSETLNGQHCRERIKHFYTISQREKLLLSIL